MKTSFQNVYQIKISLIGSKPSIWRRIQIPEKATFWDLHVAIQDAMGWEDDHLHEFQIKNAGNIVIGISSDPRSLHSTKVPVSKYLNKEKDSMEYLYDFGDSWWHKLVLEKILPKAPNQVYPVCLAGEMACPPEDSGGLGGYYYKLEVLSNPQDPDYDDVLEWMGEDFDPNHFDPNEVQFSDPESCWNIVEKYGVF